MINEKNGFFESERYWASESQHPNIPFWVWDFSENRAIAWIEGGAILIAVFVVSGVTAWNDYKKEE